MKDESELALAREFIAAHPDDAARVVERHPVPEASELLAGLPPEESGLVLEQMAPATAAECLAAMPPTNAGEVLARLSIDRAAGLLRRLPSDVAQRLLDQAPAPVLAAALRMLVAHPEGSAGALVDPTVLAVPSEMRARDALETVVREASHALYYVYAVDRAHRLVGVLTLRELMLAPPEAALSEVMHVEVERLRASAELPEIVGHPGWREHHALPVVDEDAKFLGALRYSTLRRLERSGADGNGRSPALEAAISLGELYWFGLSSVLEGMAAAMRRRSADGNGG